MGTVTVHHVHRRHAVERAVPGEAHEGDSGSIRRPCWSAIEGSRSVREFSRTASGRVHHPDAPR